MERRTRQRLVDALNGSVDNIDPTVRRGLVAIADEVDGLHDGQRALRLELDVKLAELAAHIDVRLAAQDRALAALQRTQYALGTTMVGILLSAAIGVFFTR